MGKLSSPVVLTLILWVFYGFLIHDKDLNIYTLQHAGVEALIERGTYNLVGSETPQLQNPGDIIYYREQKLAAKQPGQFTLGAIPYSVLYWFGFSYRTDYLLCAAIVSWLTTGVALAISAGLMLHLVCCVWKFSLGSGIIAGVAMGLGQTGVAYISVPHHDVLATLFLIVAFWGIERARLEASKFSLVGGFGIGLSIWCSMLVAPVALGLCAYAVIVLSARARFIAGVLAGLTPLFGYNYYYFSNPLVSANIAGGVQDTFFDLNWPRFIKHARDYLGTGQVSLFKYVPVAFVGIFAPLICWRGNKACLLGTALLLIHVAYIFNIETIGHCQYGPRYLLPVMPFLILGAAGVFEHAAAGASRIFRVVVLVALTSSIAINLLGALGGTIYCDLPNWAVPGYLRVLGIAPQIFPLTSGACIAGCLLFGLLARCAAKARTHTSPQI